MADDPKQEQGKIPEYNGLSRPYGRPIMCPQCNTFNKPGSEKCKKCGTPLIAE